MSMICIPVPELQLNRTVLLEVTVDGKKHAMNYRVESFPWPEDVDTETRIDSLRDHIRDFEGEWELLQIGPPGGGMVPVTFRQRVIEPVNGHI